MPKKRQLPYLKKLAQRGKVGVWLIDGAWLRTSLTRTDTGAGACEVMLVENVEVR